MLITVTWLSMGNGDGAYFVFVPKNWRNNVKRWPSETDYRKSQMRQVSKLTVTYEYEYEYE